MKTDKELILMIEKTKMSIHQRTGQWWFLRKTMIFLHEIGAITDEERGQLIVRLELEVQSVSIYRANKRLSGYEEAAWSIMNERGVKCQRLY